MLGLTSLSLFALLFSTTAFASDHDARMRTKRGHGSRRHLDTPADRQLVNREVEIETRDSHNNTLSKRAFTGRGTFYYTGLGACGQYSKDSDYMVALNSAQYGGGYPGPQCFKYITVQSNGVTVGGVQIMDECPTCGWGDLDLSPSLFDRFHSSNGGTLELTWWFDGEGPAPAPAPAPEPSPSPSPAWTPEPSPSPAWTPPPAPTSTWVAPSSTQPTSTWVAPSSSSSSSTAPPSSSSSSAAVSSISAFNSTNPYAVISQDNSTSTSVSLSASALGSLPSDSSDVSTAERVPVNNNQNGNLQAINGLVANYGQLIVVGAGGA